MADVEALRGSLVGRLREAGYITTPGVEQAFLDVPRHLFLPDEPVERVYEDEAIPTKIRDGVAISSSSQPAIMAIMLEQLDVRPGARILEIGAGTGYNAALLAHLTGPDGHVTTVDIDDDIVEQARAHLAAAGVTNVTVLCADGARGHLDGAPYDRVILTVGARDIAPAWVEQLTPDGRLVLPLSLGGPQVCAAFERVEAGLESRAVCPCGFMWMRGSLAGAEAVVRLGPTPGLTLIVADRGRVVPDDAYTALARGAEGETPAPAEVAVGEVYAGVAPWLAVHLPGFCTLNAGGPAAEHGVAPALFGAPPASTSTVGLVDGGALALLARPGASIAGEGCDRAELFTPLIRTYGGGGVLARRLADGISAWAAAGRPTVDRIRIRVRLGGARPGPAAGETALDLPSARLLLHWG